MAEITLKLDTRFHQNGPNEISLPLNNGDQVLIEVDGEPLAGIDVVDEDGKVAIAVGHWPDGEEWRVVAYLEKEA